MQHVHAPQPSAWPVRCASSVPKATKDLLQANGRGALQFVPAASQAPASQGGGLAILLGWMGSKHKQLRKYAELYTQRGYDVLTVTPRPQHVMVPSSTWHLVSAVARSANTLAPDSPVVTQGFSVGGFLFASMLQVSAATRGSYAGVDGGAYAAAAEAGTRVTALQPGAPPPFTAATCGTAVRTDNAEVAQLLRRTVGFVADSPVDYFGVPKGLAFAVAGQVLPHAQPSLAWGISSALAAFPGIQRFHLAASHRYLYDPLGCPAATLYSLADHVADPQPILDVHALWQKAGVQSALHIFEDTRHVLHMRQHPKQYQAAVHALLDEAEGYAAAQGQLAEPGQ